MYEIGQEEIEAVAAVITSGRLFRYMEDSWCGRFEERWASHLAVRHVRMTASGTNALTFAMMGAGIGPGDEVIVPACTYMATAVAVVAAGAIPVIVDIDESTTLDPAALARAIGPATRAVVPVHMWGVSCDMEAIMQVAQEHDLLVIEDACQAVGGAYQGRKLGAIGHLGAFSFNYFKNLSCGEGGALVTNDDGLFERAANGVDCCGFYWKGRSDSFKGYVANSSRASEIEGAILNIQLDRLDGMLEAMREQKRRITQATADVVRAAPCHSPEGECGASNLFQFDTPQQAEGFAKRAGGVVLINTGRHVYTEWDPIINHRGGHHEGMNPFTMAANAQCRMDYRMDMCQHSLDILRRTVRIDNHPRKTEAEIQQCIDAIRDACRAPTGVGGA